MIRAAVCLSLTSLMLAGCARPEQNAMDEHKPVWTRTILLPGVGAPRSDVGVPGRLDHLAYDPATGRLFVAALENGSLEVIDLGTGERVKSIGGLVHPQGIAVITSTGCVAVACGDDGKIHVYDARTLEEKRTVDVGLGADNVRYDARADTVYVTYGDTGVGAIAVLNARTWEKLREIRFPSRPESFQLDPGGVQLFANVPGGIRADNDGLVMIADRNTGRAEAEIPLRNLARNFPMAFDAVHRRLFVACRKPARLVVIDARRSAVVSIAECSEDSDDLFYDAEMNRVLVISGGFRPDMQDAAAGVRSGLQDETGAIDVFDIGDNGEPNPDRHDADRAACTNGLLRARSAHDVCGRSAARRPRRGDSRIPRPGCNRTAQLAGGNELSESHYLHISRKCIP